MQRRNLNRVMSKKEREREVLSRIHQLHPYYSYASHPRPSTANSITYMLCTHIRGYTWLHNGMLSTTMVINPYPTLSCRQITTHLTPSLPYPATHPPLSPLPVYIPIDQNHCHTHMCSPLHLTSSDTSHTLIHRYTHM